MKNTVTNIEPAGAGKVLAAQDSAWKFDVAGRTYMIPAYVTREALEAQRVELDMSEDDFAAMIAESFEEVKNDRSTYPVIRVLHDPNTEAHVFGAMLGLMDQRDPDDIVPVALGDTLYAIVVRGVTTASNYGESDDEGLQCLATYPGILPNRGSGRLVHPRVVFERIWDGARKTCEDCPHNQFADPNCKETLGLISMVFSPVTQVPELGGQYFPAMIRLSPTSIGGFTNKSLRPEKAGFMTVVGARRMSLLFALAKLTIEARRKGSQQKWGVIKWQLVTDPSEMAAVGYPKIQAGAMKLAAQIRKDMSIVEKTVQEYADGTMTGDVPANEDLPDGPGDAAEWPEDRYDPEQGPGDVPF